MASAAGKRNAAAGKRKRSALVSDAEIALVDNNFQRAVGLYSQAIGMDPENANLFADRALAHIKLGNFTEAVADADKAIILDASMAKAHVRKGIAYSNLAKKSLKAAAALAPGDVATTEIDESNQLTAGVDTELHEQVYRKILELRERFLPVLGELLGKLDKARGPRFDVIVLRKFLLDQVIFLRKGKYSIPLTTDMDMYELKLVKSLTEDIKLFRNYICLDGLSTLQTTRSSS